MVEQRTRTGRFPLVPLGVSLLLTVLLGLGGWIVITWGVRPLRDRRRAALGVCARGRPAPANASEQTEYQPRQNVDTSGFAQIVVTIPI